MDNLTKLLQETKPLYKRRKRNRAIAKIVFTISFPVFVLSGLYQISAIGDDIYLSMNNSNYQDTLLTDEFGIFTQK